MSLTIYHNPRCSKSRQTLQIITDNNVEPTIIEYLKTPLNEAQLRDLAHILGVSDNPRAMMRTKEDEYKALNLAEANNDQLFATMASSPKLIERPIVSNGETAVIGRPPENVEALL